MQERCLVSGTPLLEFLVEPFQNCPWLYRQAVHRWNWLDLRFLTRVAAVTDISSAVRIGTKSCIKHTHRENLPPDSPYCPQGNRGAPPQGEVFNSSTFTGAPSTPNGVANSVTKRRAIKCMVIYAAESGFALEVSTLKSELLPKDAYVEEVEYGNENLSSRAEASTEGSGPLI